MNQGNCSWVDVRLQKQYVIQVKGWGTADDDAICFTPGWRLHRPTYQALTEVLVCIKTCGKAYGRLDVLVNCAGVGTRALAQDTLFSVDRDVCNVDYLGQVGHVSVVVQYPMSMLILNIVNYRIRAQSSALSERAG